MDAQQQEQKMFESITSKSNVFYKAQQKDDDDLDQAEKISILCNLYQRKPNIFLERYHQYIEAEFISLFDGTECEEFYLDWIKRQAQKGSKRNQLIKNRRYLAMQELRREGSYFSNEKMREREPYLFDMMVERYLDDNEKMQLRPTVEVSESNESGFSKLLTQFDATQRVLGSDGADRFMNHVENRTVEADEEEKAIDSDFKMEFDSSDEEGREMEQSRILEEGAKHRHCAKNDGSVLMRRFRDRDAALKLKTEDEKTREALSIMHVSKKQEANPTGLMREQLYAEFVSLMEQRFLDGEDIQFFDYSQVDAGHGIYKCKADDRILEQDMEDAYFDSEEPD
uniref:CCD97-like C-terminal domain-containing protein n=1 Tax=Globodera rostochiensis TaxID=31243 RepID=A0A914HJ64_GLORO